MGRRAAWPHRAEPVRPITPACSSHHLSVQLSEGWSRRRPSIRPTTASAASRRGPRAPRCWPRRWRGGARPCPAPTATRRASERRCTFHSFCFVSLSFLPYLPLNTSHLRLCTSVLCYSAVLLNRLIDSIDRGQMQGVSAAAVAAALICELNSVGLRSLCHHRNCSDNYQQARRAPGSRKCEARWALSPQPLARCAALSA